ncbi:MAG: aldehyde ferredoxin oxidoreductase N-terminal domain-containing protein [Dehalococcoidia bacterium]|nr:aldehyde ferredoxin oxidoreductase N-terminal domain-containing protein [Dehalococcoidia bacterium]
MTPTPHGYAGNMLRVDLSSGRTWTEPTSDYFEFLGGRGIAAKVHWDESPPEAGALDPDNRLTFITGPLTGFAGFASSRWQVCAKSPVTEPEQFCYSNLGGSWGVALKFSGYDGIVVQGWAGKPVYLLVTEDSAELRDAAHLWGKGAIDTREILKSELGSSLNVVACGQAGEHMAVASGLLADMDSTGSGGMGAVMGSKTLKAIAVAKGARRLIAAHPDRLRDMVRRYRWLIGDRAPLDGVMDQYQFIDAGKTQKQYCRGCPGPCIRIAWEADDGLKGKFFCQAALMYQGRAKKFYGRETDVSLHATKLCDNYGLDTRAMHVTMGWLARCYRAGILTEAATGLPLSKEGSLEFAELLLHKIAFREGFGDLLAQGVMKAAQEVGKGAVELTGDLLHKAEQDELYGGRTYIVNGLLWAMDPRQPIGQIHETAMLAEHWVNWLRGREGAYISDKVIHDVSVRFFGSEAAADFSSYEGKALAAKMIQDREYAKECLILCDLAWPIKTSPNTEDHVGDPTMESQFLSAVTGQDIDEVGLYAIGEKVFNLHRAIWAREGHAGRLSDSLPEYNFSTPLKSQFMNPEMLVPGPEGKPASRKGAVLNRDQFEQMKGEYYKLRGWDVASGRQTRSKLEQLGLRHVADDLAKRGLLADSED